MIKLKTCVSCKKRKAKKQMNFSFTEIKKKDIYQVYVKTA